MRLAVVIITLAAMAVTLVHIRRAEIAARNEIEQLYLQRRQFRRVLWDQQIVLSELTNPRAVRDRSQEMSLGLVDGDRPARGGNHASTAGRAAGH